MQKIRRIFKWVFATRKRIIATVFVVVVLIVAVFYLANRNKNKVLYQTARVERGAVVSSVSASGTIISSNLMPVTSLASGVVKEVFVKDGQKVYKGQKIAEIDLDEDGQKQYASGYASLMSARNSLNAANNSYRSALASLEKVYDDIKGHDSDETFVMKETRTKAEVAKDNAYDALSNARANLDTAAINFRSVSPVITAPASGIIGNITVVKGMILSSSGSSSTSQSGSRIAVVTGSGNLLASFNISEVDVPRVKQGQKTTIILDSISDKTFTGEVVSVDRIGTVTNGVTNYPVVIQFSTQSEDILPNMSATANIIIETKTDVLVVPNAAIVSSSNNQNSVRVLKDGKEVSIPVEIGVSSDTLTEVVSGLNEGDEVITGTLTSGASRTKGQTSPFSSFGGGGIRPR